MVGDRRILRRQSCSTAFLPPPGVQSISMDRSISCTCGYSGPVRRESGRNVCPLCRQPALEPAAEKQWRIPCPNGHVFKTPESWIGRQMICPKCNEPFVLKLADSLEKRQERRRRQEAEEAKFAQTWLTRAIWAAVLVVGFLVSLIVLSLAK